MGFANLLSLVTLLLLIAFALLYLSKSIEKKPDLLIRAVDLITRHINLLAMAALGYGIICAFLSLLQRYAAIDLLIHLISNVLIALMALPFALEKLIDKLTAKYPEHMGKNQAIIAEVRNFSAWILRHEKNFGYTGAAFAVLMFVITFR